MPPPANSLTVTAKAGAWLSYHDGAVRRHSIVLAVCGLMGLVVLAVMAVVHRSEPYRALLAIVTLLLRTLQYGHRRLTFRS